MQSIKDIWDAFIQAIIRFWDNRFLKNDEIDYLRNELARVNGINQKLIEQMISPVTNNEEKDEIKDFRPIGNKFVPWSIRRQQLERNSIKKLEEELLMDTDKENREP